MLAHVLKETCIKAVGGSVVCNREAQKQLKCPSIWDLLLKNKNKKKNDRASIGQNSAHTLKRKKQMWVYDMEVTE